MKAIFPFFIKSNTTGSIINMSDSEYYMRGITYKKQPISDFINSNTSCLLYEKYSSALINNSTNLINDIFIFNEENKINEIILILKKSDDEIINLLKSSMHKNTLFIK